MKKKYNKSKKKYNKVKKSIKYNKLKIKSKKSKKKYNKSKKYKKINKIKTLKGGSGRGRGKGPGATKEEGSRARRFTIRPDVGSRSVSAQAKRQRRGTKENRENFHCSYLKCECLENKKYDALESFNCYNKQEFPITTYDLRLKMLIFTIGENLTNLIHDKGEIFDSKHYYKVINITDNIHNTEIESPKKIPIDINITDNMFFHTKNPEFISETGSPKYPHVSYTITFEGLKFFIVPHNNNTHPFSKAFNLEYYISPETFASKSNFYKSALRVAIKGVGFKRLMTQLLFKYYYENPEKGIKPFFSSTFDGGNGHISFNTQMLHFKDQELLYRKAIRKDTAAKDISRKIPETDDMKLWWMFYELENLYYTIKYNKVLPNPSGVYDINIIIKANILIDKIASMHNVKVLPHTEITTYIDTFKRLGANTDLNDKEFLTRRQYYGNNKGWSRIYAEDYDEVYKFKGICNRCKGYGLPTCSGSNMKLGLNKDNFNNSYKIPIINIDNRTVTFKEYRTTADICNFEKNIEVLELCYNVNHKNKDKLKKMITLIMTSKKNIIINSKTIKDKRDNNILNKLSSDLSKYLGEKKLNTAYSDNLNELKIYIDYLIKNKNRTYKIKDDYCLYYLIPNDIGHGSIIKILESILGDIEIQLKGKSYKKTSELTLSKSKPNPELTMPRSSQILFGTEFDLNSALWGHIPYDVILNNFFYTYINIDLNAQNYGLYSEDRQIHYDLVRDSRIDFMEKVNILADDGGHPGLIYGVSKGNPFMVDCSCIGYGIAPLNISLKVKAPGDKEKTFSNPYLAYNYERDAQQNQQLYHHFIPYKRIQEIEESVVNNTHNRSSSFIGNHSITVTGYIRKDTAAFDYVSENTQLINPEKLIIIDSFSLSNIITNSCYYDPFCTVCKEDTDFFKRYHRYCYSLNILANNSIVCKRGKFTVSNDFCETKVKNNEVSVYFDTIQVYEREKTRFKEGNFPKPYKAPGLTSIELLLFTNLIFRYIVRSKLVPNANEEEGTEIQRDIKLTINYNNTGTLVIDDKEQIIEDPNALHNIKQDYKNRNDFFGRLATPYVEAASPTYPCFFGVYTLRAKHIALYMYMILCYIMTKETITLEELEGKKSSFDTDVLNNIIFCDYNSNKAPTDRTAEVENNNRNIGLIIHTLIKL